MICDGEKHCVDGNDESSETCQKKNYQSCNKENDKKNCSLTYDLHRHPLISKKQLKKELNNCIQSTCLIGEYKCKFHGYCIKIDQYCDGIDDCLLGDDEIDCGKTKRLKEKK